MKSQKFSRMLTKYTQAFFAACLSLGIAQSVMSAPAQDPLFLTQPVRPIMMLNMSNDHQLYFKLYDDYSDITNPNGEEPDGQADTTYIHNYKYYGYFDSEKCYVYNSTQGRFNPNRKVQESDRYCNYTGGSNEWSGNLLNWATMTRIDAIRKILYGGMRSTDNNSGTTVLERAYIPEDAHAFAKYYNGSDIAKLTPFTVPAGAVNTRDTGITFCSSTVSSSYSQNVTAAPQLKVAKHNYSLWASNEGIQCRWGSRSNDNDPAASGIYAYSSSPKLVSGDSSAHGLGEYNVRVRVCQSSFIAGDRATNYENCKAYPNGHYKPTGLLQTYGENGSIHFGLLTGSYGKNKSGGVLRKRVGGMNDEIVANTGQFTVPTTGSIVDTLNKLRIYGYDHASGLYIKDNWPNYPDVTGLDNCLWGRSSFENGRCTNWGNPQTEIFLESLRYLAGKKSPLFDVDDSSYVTGIKSILWDDPINNDNYCAPLNVIQFNASTSSYDWDELDKFSDIASAGANLNTITDEIGAAEGIHGKNYFVGVASEALNNQLCTPKTVSNLSQVKGTCPDAPRLEGSYQMAGMAYHARKNGIAAGREKVFTYGVALAPAVPQVKIPVPGAGNEGKTVTILPACRNLTTTIPTNCSIVDFKVVSQTQTATTNSGTLYVNWEDSEQGGDYDQDMWGTIKYEVTAATVKVSTKVIAQSASHHLGFGYVISGTEQDGFHVHSGINKFAYTPAYPGLRECSATDPAKRCTCLAGQTSDDWQGRCNHPSWGETSQTYVIGTSTAELLQQPLYYAAKWGGYADPEAGEANTAAIAGADPSTYFYATDPRELEQSLTAAFADVASRGGSASAAATNSTRLSEGSFLYQASFHSGHWSGELVAYQFDKNGGQKPGFISTNNTLITGVSRNIYTFNDIDGETVDFTWDNLTDAQRTLIKQGGDDNLGESRVEWLQGLEGTGLRARPKTGAGKEILLGDIVNASPVYLGGTDMRYERLPGAAGSSYRTYLTDSKSKRTPYVFVGANDGMLHAFNGSTLEEIFAYVPVGAYPKLANITKDGYGKGGAQNPHQYIVDGPIAVGDAYLQRGAAREWRSIVVGTLGGGGRSIFALDVTDPNNPNVLFEFNDTASLGYVMGQPYIVPLKDGASIRWAVVFGNGYESGSTRLNWIDLDNPTSINSVVASAAGKGLSAPALLPDGNGLVEAAYAGDLDGNLWRFKWSSLSNAEALRLFRATSSGGDPQSITAAPTLGINASRNNAIMIYFGTGQYIYHTDNTSAISTQSIYAIIDKGEEVQRNSLDEKLITGAARNVTNNDIDWGEHDGWFMNLPSAGERVINKLLLMYDKLIFSTLIPSAQACDYGGRSWIMEVPAVGDKYVGHSILDGNVENDFLILGNLSFGLLPPGRDSGNNGDNGGDTPQPPLQCEPGQHPAKVFAVGSDGSLVSQDACLDGNALGRMSWRQLR